MRKNGSWRKPSFHGQAAREQLAALFGLREAPPVNMPAHSLRRMQADNIVTRLAHGEYRFEDEAFAQWFREHGALNGQA